MQSRIRIAIAAAVLMAAQCLAPAHAEVAFTESGLWYETRGIGPPALLLHGSNLDHHSFDEVATALAADHQVVSTDLRFHGQSRDDGGKVSFVNDVTEVLDAAKVQRVTLIGHSMGAGIAVDYALANPDRVETLVLLAPTVSGFAPTTRPQGLDDFIAAMRKGDIDAAGAELAKTPVMQLHKAKENQEAVTASILRNLHLFRTDPSRVEQSPPAAERLGELTMPLTVVVGELDASGVLEVVEFVASKVPRAKVVKVPGCGHLVVFDCAGDVVKAVGD